MPSLYQKKSRRPKTVSQYPSEIESHNLAISPRLFHVTILLILLLDPINSIDDKNSNQTDNGAAKLAVSSSQSEASVQQQISISASNDANNFIKNNNMHLSDDIYLESMDDLDHVAHLLLLNYNLTDEALIQANWLMNSANALTSHKQYLKSSPSNKASIIDPKERQEIMLESFITHLRNGHLRRLSLDELQSMVSGLNETYPYSALNIKLQHYPTVSSNNETPTQSGSPILYHEERELSDSRCQNLVALYQFELFRRNQIAYDSRIQDGGQGDRDSGFRLTENPTNLSADYKSKSSNDVVIKQNRSVLTQLQDGKHFYHHQQQQYEPKEDVNRLSRLCKLAIGCHSAEKLVELISKPWKVTSATSTTPTAEPLDSSRLELADTSKARRSPSGVEDLIERESSINDRPNNPLPEQESSMDDEEKQQQQSVARRKSLRDSLSLSIAKLCPLMLFQLHEDDGVCNTRRDDRPPMITVWAFATLFVTIVSFCSLIGLSLTPLLGESATEGSMDSVSAANELQQQIHNSPPITPTFNGTRQGGRKGQHRASLTLFEGLAVGSLVGSALFSLIPQAFELQERESNQSFLLKAFIIFSGIYLFFCSERLMRIILDTRQKHKKKKRLTNRSSTTIAIEPHNLFPPPFANQFPNRQQHSMRNLSSNVVNQHSTSSGLKSGGSSNLHLVRKQENEFDKDGKPSRGMLRASKLIKDHSDQQSIIRMAEKMVSSSKQHNNAQMRQHQGTTPRPSVVNIVNSTSASRRTKLRSRHHQQQQKKHQRRQQRSKRVATSYLGNKVVANNNIKCHQIEDESDCDYYNPRHMSVGSTECTSSSSSFTVSLTTAERQSRSGLRGSGLRSATNESRESSCCRSSSSSDGRKAFYLANTRHHRVGFSSLCDHCASSDSDNNNQARAVNRYLKQLNNQQEQQYQMMLSAGNNLAHNDDGLIDQSEHRCDSMFCNDENVENFIKPSRGLRYLNATTSIQMKQQDISTVAWMIILGDGLHNFIDGISIGAAFSESILSGVSISVAVICEEFPHELGDFAVLVSSGMTVRQALGYNFLSACTCYIGMAVGIILGDVTDGASYISALAAGVFLYIAMVDMMGELSATLEATSRDSIAKTLKLLLLQNIGIFIGISIIFILSFIDF